MSKREEPANPRMQELLAQLHTVLSVMNDLAQEQLIESVPFLGGCIQFGIGEIKYSSDYRSHSVVALTPFAKGPRSLDYPWSESTFQCWPTDDQREWVFSDDRSAWPKTSYEED